MSSSILSRLLLGLRSLVSYDPAWHRRARQECARLAASLFGDFPISEDHKLWREDKAFLRRYAELCPTSIYSQDRKFVLRAFAQFASQMPGAMAECGCFRGASAFFMAEANPGVPLHLFDSFEGLSAPTARDLSDKPDVRPWSGGDLSATEEETRKALQGFRNVYYHKGWIPSQFHAVQDQIFSLVHIDVDLYKPTLDSLEFFFPRLTLGGVIVLDDYGFTTCPGANAAAEEFVQRVSNQVVHITTGQGLIFRLLLPARR